MSETSNSTEQKNFHQVAHRDPGAWLLLSFLTLGILYYVWLYKVTKDIRKLEGHELGSYVEFIISIIILPYGIYYVYKLAKRAEVLSSKTNKIVIEDLSVSCLIMSLVPLGTFIAITIIQATLNKMLPTIKQGV